MHAHDIGIALDGWAADWPDGWGFFYYLVDGNAIAPTGNTNLAQLNDPVMNNLFTKMAASHRRRHPELLTSQIDEQVMKDAAILPGVYAKSLLYRSPTHQRLRPALLRHVQLRRAGREVVIVKS